MLIALHRRLVAQTTGQIQQYQNDSYALEPVQEVQDLLIALPSLQHVPIELPPPGADPNAIEQFEVFSFPVVNSGQAHVFSGHCVQAVAGN